MATPLTDNTVPARLAGRAATSPDAIAFRHQGADGRWQVLDWQDFSHRVDQLRCGLAAAGLRRGDRLALVAPVSLAWELVHHAALAMGVSVVGLDAHDLPDRLAAMADQAEVVAFAVAEPAVLAGLSARRRAATRLWIAVGPAPVDTGGAPHWTTLDALMALGRAHPAPPAPTAGDEATVIFTSGTTGAPKGIAYSHGQLGLAIDAIATAFSFVGPQGRLLCWLPLSNLFQRVVNLAAVQNGAGTYLLGDPRQVMAHVALAEPDVFIGVPRFYEKLHEGLEARVSAMPPPLRALVRWGWQVGYQTLDRRRAHLPLPLALAARHWLAERLVLRRIRKMLGPRLRCLVSGSAPMPRHLLDDFEALGWPLLEAYGLSENVVPMAMNTLAAHRPGSVGKPVHGNQLRVSSDGNVQVRGPGVFRGYLGDAGEGQLDDQGWYDTGDLGIIDGDGYLTLTGRSGDIIKTSTGRRIAPVAIESTLQGVAGVDQAVLVGANRKYLVAICTCLPSDSFAATVASLRAPLASALATLSAHERPVAIGFLPRAFDIQSGEVTTNLKLRRNIIAKQHQGLIDQLDEVIDSKSTPPDHILVFS
jgi:long-chain acyl-CoA synthetase